MGPPYGKLPIPASISLGILDREWYGKLVWGPRGPMSLGVRESPTDFEQFLL